jgi:hypothetical protein
VARIRQVKPEFFLDDGLAASCCRDARLLFIGLWTLADREGRLEDRPAKIKAQVFPYDDDITLQMISELINELTTDTCVVRYEVEDKRFLWIRTMKIHQHFHKDEQASKLPEPSRDIKIHRTSTGVAPGLHRGYGDDTSEGKNEPQNVDMEKPDQIYEQQGNIKKHRTCTHTSTSTSGYRVSGIGDLPKGTGAKKHRTSQRTRCPDAFDFSGILKEWASREFPSLNVEAETEKFLDHYRANGKSFVNWDAAWKNWMRKAWEWNGQKPRQSGLGLAPPTTTTDADLAAKLAELGKPLEAIEIGSDEWCSLPDCPRKSNWLRAHMRQT